jgi:hypothetical protein
MTRARLHLALAVALLAFAAGVLGTGFSGAAMTDGVTDAPATFKGGTLELTASSPAASQLDASFMRPGQSRGGVVALRNTGDVPAVLSAGKRDLVDAPVAAALSAVLELRIEDCGASADCESPALVSATSLRDFETAEIGALEAGATRHVRVTLVWGATKSDPSRQGASAAFTIVWQAVAGKAA